MPFQYAPELRRSVCERLLAGESAAGLAEELPIFVGVPLAGILSAVSSARRREWRWAGYSVGSSLAMMASFVLFGRGFGGAPRLAAKARIF